MKENEIKNIILDYCEVGGVSDIDELVEEIKKLFDVSDADHDRVAQEGRLRDMLGMN
tara:strand:- start:31 stop:201 length:171 start_codon:yes stop_codon:yes gene_type:complete